MRHRRPHGIIKLPLGYRFVWVVLHEIAHCVTTERFDDKVAPHGPEFVRVYFDLVWDHLGASAACDLYLALYRHGVKKSPPARRPPGTADMSGRILVGGS